MDAYAQERARLRRLWANTVPIADAQAVGGRTYLQRRGIPADVAVAARVRYAGLWGSMDTFTGPAVVFPMQDADGKLVAAEGRFMTPPADVATTYRAGAKGGGVFQAMPGALDAVGVTLVEGPVTALSVAACGHPAVALCGQYDADVARPTARPARRDGESRLVRDGRRGHGRADLPRPRRRRRQAVPPGTPCRP